MIEVSRRHHATVNNDTDEVKFVTNECDESLRVSKIGRSLIKGAKLHIKSEVDSQDKSDLLSPEVKLALMCLALVFQRKNHSAPACVY